jgi:hypothetical protein
MYWVKRPLTLLFLNWVAIILVERFATRESLNPFVSLLLNPLNGRIAMSVSLLLFAWIVNSTRVLRCHAPMELAVSTWEMETIAVSAVREHKVVIVRFCLTTGATV